MRKGAGVDINLSVQTILNCATHEAGSCHGGFSNGVYEWGREHAIPFDTCQVYEATDNECNPSSICRTCWDFDSACEAVAPYPNATVAEHGIVVGEAAIMTELYARGPVACDVDADPLHQYTTGILDFDGVSPETNHVVSIVGWGVETEDDGSKMPYWIVRNSWGEVRPYYFF